MKMLTLLLCFGLLAGSRAASAEQDNHTPGFMDFQGALPSGALTVYKEITHLELIIDSRAKRIETFITFKTDHPVSKAEAAKLVEKALLEQAGLVITHLDAKRVSVTYNDALPIAPAKKGEKP